MLRRSIGYMALAIAMCVSSVSGAADDILINDFEDDVATMRVLVDRPMHELVGGNGACYKTSAGGSGAKPIGTVSVTAEGGTATIASLGIYELQSAWKK